jgi:hypothetical protein
MLFFLCFFFFLV